MTEQDAALFEVIVLRYDCEAVRFRERPDIFVFG